jgi:hypothetical protein
MRKIEKSKTTIIEINPEKKEAAISRGYAIILNNYKKGD